MAPPTPPRPAQTGQRPGRTRRRGAGVSAHLGKLALHWSTEDAFQIERPTTRTRRYGILLAIRSRT